MKDKASYVRKHQIEFSEGLISGPLKTEAFRHSYHSLMTKRWLIIGYSVPVQLLWTVHESKQRKFDLLV